MTIIIKLKPAKFIFQWVCPAARSHVLTARDGSNLIFLNRFVPNVHLGFDISRAQIQISRTGIKQIYLKVNWLINTTIIFIKTAQNK